MSRRCHFSPLLIIAIMWLAFALRLWGIADHSIWWDEGRSASMVRFPITEIVRQLADGNHPPLHYMVLRGWWLLVGDGEFVLRFSSVLFGLLWVALTYRLGMVVGDRRTAQMGALLLAISRFAIVWSQQVRMYTWSTLWTTLVMITALSFWRRRHWFSLLIYLISAAAGILSLYLTISSVITVNLGFLIVWFVLGKSGRFFLQWVSAQLGVLLVTIPWLLLNASQAETWAVTETITLFDYIKLYASILVVGSPIDISRTLPFTIMAVAVFIGAVVIVVMRQKQIWQRIGLGLLSTGLVTQAFVVYAVCFGIVPGFTRPLVPRYLLLLSTCFYVIAGWGMSTSVKIPFLRDKNGLKYALVGMFIVPQLIGLSTLYPGRVRRDDYISIADTLRLLRHPEDALILYVDRDWPVFEAHYVGWRYNVPYEMDLNEESVDKMLSPWWYEHGAVWLVTTPESLQADPNQHIPAWLAAHSLSSETVIHAENKLTLYIRNPERQGTAYTITSDVMPGDNLLEARDLANVNVPLNKYRTGDTIHLAFTWITKPQAGYSVEVEGRTIHKRQDIKPLIYESEKGYVYQLVDINLDPGMPGGKYRLTVVDDEKNIVAVKPFELIHAGAGLDIALDKIPNPVSYRLGESIHLIGYTLAETNVKPGDYIELTLYWRAVTSISSRYKVFTHVLGENFNANTGNFLWGQLDNEPGRGQALTTLWTPQSVIIDPYEIVVDPQAPPGSYMIEIGMYGLVDVARLPVAGPGERIIDDAVQLASIEIISP